MSRLAHAAPAWAPLVVLAVSLAGCRGPHATTGATPVAAKGLELEGTPATPAAPATLPPPPVPRPTQPPSPGAVAPASTGTVSHAAVGCWIQASSTSLKEGGEGGPECLVDGDLATRWSSAYAEPQQINLRFAKPVRIARLRLYWESAAARRYAVAISPDGQAWTTVHVHMNLSAKPVARTDDVNLKGITAVAMRLELQERVNPEWGFSLHEIEVVPAR